MQHAFIHACIHEYTRNYRWDLAGSRKDKILMKMLMVMMMKIIMIRALHQTHTPETSPKNGGCAELFLKHIFGAISDDLEEGQRREIIEKLNGFEHFSFKVSVSLETS